MEDVSGTANAAVSYRGVLASLRAVELLIKGQRRTLAGLVDVASAADAAEEATGGRCGSGSVRGRGVVGVVGDTGDVTSAATTRADVGGCGGGWLGDNVVGHFGSGGGGCDGGSDGGGSGGVGENGDVDEDGGWMIQCNGG